MPTATSADSGTSPPPPAPCRQPPASPSSSTRLGTTCGRRPDAGANTPWYVTRCFRGFGTSAHSRSISTSFVITTAVVPSRQRFFSAYPIRPSASSTSRDAATDVGQWGRGALVNGPVAAERGARMAAGTAGSFEQACTERLQVRPNGRRHRPRIEREQHVDVFAFGLALARRGEENCRDERWGYTRIVGVLGNVGHTVARTTVAKILKAAGIAPAPERPTSWRTFLKAHAGTIA